MFLIGALISTFIVSRLLLLVPTSKNLLPNSAVKNFMSAAMPFLYCFRRCFFLLVPVRIFQILAPLLFPL